MGYSFEVLKLLAKKIDDGECLFPDVADDFLKCEFYLEGGCSLFDKIDCAMLSDSDRNEIKFIKRMEENEKQK